ncbi:hypothetical protein ONE63_011265 [Megalurothrips usitatus]|uniref:DUF4371 domain-containing protein n=1 Tax=Megalurothrips usitatus TaxID=439358 RepID=A0AAV7X6H6_9NEOP|nr:hypothetical protein ONE63_011265 [Megalurothrips usitatus]
MPITFSSSLSLSWILTGCRLYSRVKGKSNLVGCGIALALVIGVCVVRMPPPKRKASTIDNFFNKAPKAAASEIREISDDDADDPGEVTVVPASRSDVPEPTGSEPSVSVCPNPTHSSKDISLLLASAKGSKLTAEDKKHILENVWKPSIAFKFPPSGTRNLKFQLKWLGEFDRLTTGKMQRKCLKRIRTLLTIKTRWSAAEFLKVSTGSQDSIDVQVDTAARRTVMENRAKLAPIIETILFCGRQGIALRGHRDSGPVDPSGAEPATNEGNFRALVRFKIRSGDQKRAEHLETCGRNTYMSPTVQNSIIVACKNVILRDLVNKINASKGFSVLADETTDKAKIEQLTLCIRFFDGDHLREEFLLFIPVTDLSGVGLGTVIVQALQDVGIDLAYMFGQGYDGASAMQSRFQGVQSYVRGFNPLAISTHCSAHSLNLVITHACAIPAITHCMAIVESAYDFFRHAKRNNALQKAIETLNLDTLVTRLKRLIATRWIQRHECAFTLLDLILPVSRALEDVISSWSDRDAVRSAVALQNALHDCGFLVSLKVVAAVFAVSLPLSRQLQTKELDIAAALHLADAAKGALQDMRDNAATHFAEIFSETEKLCRSLDVQIEIPRRCVRQL